MNLPQRTQRRFLPRICADDADKNTDFRIRVICVYPRPKPNSSVSSVAKLNSFEYSSRAHAAADAHRHHSVSRVSSFHFLQ